MGKVGRAEPASGQLARAEAPASLQRRQQGLTHSVTLPGSVMEARFEERAHPRNSTRLSMIRAHTSRASSEAPNL